MRLGNKAGQERKEKRKTGGEVVKEGGERGGTEEGGEGKLKRRK